MRLVAAAIVALLVAGSLAACIDEDCPGTPGCPVNTPKPEPTPTKTFAVEGTGTDFCPTLQAYMDDVSASYVDQGQLVDFDPDVFLSYGIYDLPPGGCSTGIIQDPPGEYGTPEHGHVTWYVADPKFCTSLNQLLQIQLAASGYSVRVNENAAFHSVVIEGDRGTDNDIQFDYDCTELRADNVAQFNALGPFMFGAQAGTAYANLTLNYYARLDAGG